MTVRTSEEELEAIHAGRTYANLGDWRRFLVRGPDARRWLHDLLTADIAGLPAGEARRSLLLTPNGRIRADVTVTTHGDSFLLIQDSAQATPLGDLLAPYVLSSEVTVEAAEELDLLAFPHADRGVADGFHEPSCVGPGTGFAGPAGRVGDLTNGRTEIGADALAAWRIERGRARFPIDLTDRSLPHEAGLEHTIDFEKGCYLGQEAVAKVRNLGRPPFAVVSASSRAPVDVGDRILDGNEDAGTVTSAAVIGDSTFLIARIRWGAQEAALRVEDGAPLEIVGLASGDGTV